MGNGTDVDGMCAMLEGFEMMCRVDTDVSVLRAEFEVLQATGLGVIKKLWHRQKSSADQNTRVMLVLFSDRLATILGDDGQKCLQIAAVFTRAIKLVWETMRAAHTRLHNAIHAQDCATAAAEAERDECAREAAEAEVFVAGVYLIE